MDRDLQAIILRDNPWIERPDTIKEWYSGQLPDNFLARSAVDRNSGRWSEPSRAHLVIGPRQAGKSTAIWAHLARRGEPVLYLDCEQALIKDWCRAAPLFLADMEKQVPAGTPLFFDEIQHLDEAGLFLKGLVDRHIDVPVLVTGSSSFHLGARTRESLAGRATRTRLFPFSLAEVCQDLVGRPEALRDKLMRERVERLLIFGGYPEVWLSSQPASLLTDLVESIILRDASDLFRIARPDVFRQLLRLASAQVGNLVNLAEWSGILGVSRDTVAGYIEILEAAHVLVLLPPYAGGKRSELTKQPKVFLVDNGIRNRLAGDFRPLPDRTDAGALLENWVFAELWKTLPEDSSLHFWRSTSKSEVDFVVVSPGQTIGIEVKKQRIPRPQLPRSSRSFIEAYHPARFLVVNLELEHRDVIGATQIDWILPEHLADSLSSPG